MKEQLINFINKQRKLILDKFEEDISTFIEDNIEGEHDLEVVKAASVKYLFNTKIAGIGDNYYYSYLREIASSKTAEGILYTIK